MAVPLALWFGAARAEDVEYLPRSSNPRGFRMEDAVAKAPAVMAVPGMGGSAASSSARGGDGAGASGSGGKVLIQGTTTIQSTGQNIDSTALGTRNKGCTRVGGIGECQ
ncbi:hypothetical protein MCP1_140062 [Candidatus Terasakiella magnetica]|nr:hypothetical protein MCP1_140062 [Candidatus Terasakiella magnetica]